MIKAERPAQRREYRLVNYTPGMRTIISDEEWMVKKVAPFSHCCREQDYETARRFFEEKYGKAVE